MGAYYAENKAFRWGPILMWAYIRDFTVHRVLFFLFFSKKVSDQSERECRTHIAHGWKWKVEVERIYLLHQVKTPKLFLCKCTSICCFCLGLFWQMGLSTGGLIYKTLKNFFFGWGYLQGEAIYWVGLSTILYGSSVLYLLVFLQLDQASYVFCFSKIVIYIIQLTLTPLISYSNNFFKEERKLVIHHSS